MEQGVLGIQPPGAMPPPNEQADPAAHRQQPDQREERFESQLALHIRGRWEDAQRGKEAVENRILDCKRRVHGQYDPEKRQAIEQQGGSTIYMMLTAIKTRTARAWLTDVLLPGGDRPWTLEPTSRPNLSPQEEQQLQQKVQQDAMAAAQRGMAPSPEQMQQVADQVRDQLLEQKQEQAEEQAAAMVSQLEDMLDHGGWRDAFADVISDVVDYPAGVLKGPILRRQERLQWAENMQTGGRVPVVEDQVIEHFQRVDPLDFYPEPNARSVQDAGYIIERLRLDASDLYDLIGLEGFDEDAIREVIREHDDGEAGNWLAQAQSTDSESRRARGDWSGSQPFQHNQVDVLEFWGRVSGQMLQDWGLSEAEVPDPEKQYPICAWLAGRHVLKAQLNPNPLGEYPYGVANWEPSRDSIWGRALPEIIADSQDICNACARAITNNMGIASGPQVMVDTRSLPPGEDITQMYPWKIWQYAGEPTQNSSAQAPIQFFQPNPIAQTLMQVYEFFERRAEEISGVPQYLSGSSQTTGAASTASGLSMLMDAASKALKDVVRGLDNHVVRPTVYRAYIHEMVFGDDDSIKGDLNVIPRGAMALLVQDQRQARAAEMLQLTANPVDQQIMGLEGRAALLRQVFNDMDLDTDEIVKEDAELRQMMQQQQAAAAEEAQAAKQQESGSGASSGLGGGSATGKGGSNNGQQSPQQPSQPQQASPA